MRPAVLDPATAAERLSRAGFKRARTLAQLATRALRLVPTRVGLATLPLGASRFGGAPDVPEGFSWPTRDGAPLELLAQLDLAAPIQPGRTTAALPGLPPRGWLLFFIDIDATLRGWGPGDARGTRVVYVDEPVAALARTMPPRPDGNAHTRCCALHVSTTLDLVDPADGLLEEAGLAIPEEQWWEYLEVGRQLIGLPRNTAYHHLLGHPQQRQGDMRSECQLGTHGVDLEGLAAMPGTAARRVDRLLATAATEWVLLLQLDSDPDGPGWRWADAGKLYVWIRRADLAARAFDKAWTILQR